MSKDLLASTVSRCVFQNNVPLAKFLIRNYKSVQDHVHIVNDNVRLHNPHSFSLHISSLRRSAISSCIEQQENIANSTNNKSRISKSKSRISVLSGMLRQWVPFSRFLSLTAILDETGAVIANSPNSILSSLASYWKP
eukprot:11610067-Karenia_brevis.AAC.1